MTQILERKVIDRILEETSNRRRPDHDRAGRGCRDDRLHPQDPGRGGRSRQRHLIFKERSMPLIPSSCRPIPPALPRLHAAAADDPRRHAPRESHRVSRRGDQRRGRQPGGHEVPFPAVREPHAGNQLLHQQPGGKRVEHAGDLRHDAVHRMPDRDLLHRAGRLGRGRLLAGGSKGRRYALPHSKIMIHQPYGQVGGQVSDIEIQAEEIVKSKQVINEILAQAHRPADRARLQGHGTRPLSDRRSGQGIRPGRRSRRADRRPREGRACAPRLLIFEKVTESCHWSPS